MSTINTYVLIDRDGAEEDYEYRTLAEAKEHVDGDHAIMERTYSYEDTSLIWTADGSLTWPPVTWEVGAEGVMDGDDGVSDFHFTVLKAPDARGDMRVRVHETEQAIWVGADECWKEE